MCPDGEKLLMQEGLSRNWKNKQNRVGVFGEFTVTGHMYEGQDGETGWHITAWKTGRDPVHAYWVSAGDFFAASLQIDYRTRIEIRENINQAVNEEEQAAVFKAIAEWEKPEESIGV
jgi:hypothetical protein